MLRIRASNPISGKSPSLPSSYKTNDNHRLATTAKGSRRSAALSTANLLLLAILIFAMGMMYSIRNVPSGVGTSTASGSRSMALSSAFDDLIRRAKANKQNCENNMEAKFALPVNHNVTLPTFGFLQDLEQYQTDSSSLSSYGYQCILPPEQECQEEQFTMIFLAHNPDRLQKVYNQIIKMTSQDFGNLVKEVIIVWNAPSPNLQDTKLGRALLDLPRQGKPVRMAYPIDDGFPNDLFNRYHPRIGVTTKAILYYDDDGPFYSYKAILGGFEMWKRNANAQIGAMARKLDFSNRQLQEQSQFQKSLPEDLGDRFFVSHCPVDQIRYNFNEFAQFGAKMVLPSGSFLHSNYLGCLWHPLFQTLRNFVQEHPVHPDDGTVSAIVSQLAGRAPKVYSRRINESQQRRRKLLEATTNETVGEEEWANRRRLMDGLNWDAPGMHDKKMNWGELRSDVANSLARYFGSINSGSLGWCFGTEYDDGKGYCRPDQATVGMIPWLNPDHTAKTTCP